MLPADGPTDGVPVPSRTGGVLGPGAAARLRALAEQIARLERERVEVLVLVAEAQGQEIPDGARLAWDLAAEPPRWWIAADAG